MRLLPLGIGDAFSARHYSSCLALEAAGHWLLLDCPHPIRKMMREASTQAGLDLDVPQLDACLLTHLHADHSSGLEGLGFYSRFILGKQMPLFTHAEVAADLWPVRLAGGMASSVQKADAPPVRRDLSDFFDLTLLAPGEPRSVGPFTVHCRKTIHSIPTIALRIEAGGRSFGYSADTAFDPTLIDWLAAADLVVHEAGGGQMHTAYSALAELPASVRRKMRLIHCADQFDVPNPVIDLLRQGELSVV